MQMDRSPDDGCKIQYTCCGRSMVIVKFKLVNVRTTNEADATANGTALDGYVNHGTKLLKGLV